MKTFEEFKEPIIESTRQLLNVKSGLNEAKTKLKIVRTNIEKLSSDNLDDLSDNIDLANIIESDITTKIGEIEDSIDSLLRTKDFI